MKVNVMLDEGAKTPTKAHDFDGGFDLYSPKDICVWAHESTVIDTGVHIEIPNWYVGFLKSKSGLNVKHGIEGEGVIDAGYTGSIVVKLYNHSNKNYHIQQGDKIIQLVILPIPQVELQLVNKFKETERGNNGFGSSGR